MTQDCGTAWHPEGIYQCNGCGRLYPEYVNGCINDHEPPRKVALLIEDLAESSDG